MFNQINKNIRKYFGISRTEANGILVLILLMMFFIFLPSVYRSCGNEGYRNYERDLALMDSFAASIPGLLTKDPETDTSEQVMPAPASFDPNEATFDRMIRMGFDTILSKRILSYRKKGGRFYREADLLKIYDFPLPLYERIRPYIRIAEDHTVRAEPLPDTAAPNPVEILLYFDLNEADTLQLSLVKGIGPVLSGRIVKYRELLGGFVGTDQLDEVYGLRDGSLENLKKAVYINPDYEPEVIRVNFSEWKDLVRHPYISSDLANRILNNRSMEGPYIDGINLVQRLGMPDSLSRKILPYLVF